MVAHADARRAVLFEIVTVVRVVPEQLLGLLPRKRMLLLLQEHHGVVQTRRVVVRRAFEHRFQQGLGLIEGAAVLANARQQAQGAHIVPVLAQIVPQDLLRRRKVAIREQAVGRHHLRRQLSQRRQMLGRHGGLGGVA